MSTAAGLGQALGLGLQKGVQTGLQQVLTNFKKQTQRQEAFNKERQKNIANIDKSIENTFTSAGLNIKDKGTVEVRKLQDLAEKRTISGEVNAARNVAQEAIDADIAEEGKQLAENVIEGKPFRKKDERPRGKRGPTKGGPTFFDDLTRLEPKFKRGFTRESVAASLLGKQLTSEEVAAKAIENPSFAEELAEQVGVVAADLPFLAIGGAIGGPVGALALPEFLRSSADEIWDLARSEDKITIAKGGEAALRVAEKTAKGAITGAVLKKIPGLTATLKKIPGAEKFLDNFIAEKLIDIGATSGVLATVPSVLEGRAPTGRDFASALALTLGFETLAVPETIKRNIESKGEKSGLTPEEFSERVETKAKEAGVDFEKVQAGEGKENQKFNRVVNEISKEAEKPTIRKARKVAEEVTKPEIAKEKLKEREKEARVLARKAAKSPVEAFSESVRAKEKPTAAQIFDQIVKSFDKIKEEIRNPEIVDVEKVERRAANDKRAIEKANDILKRGELLSEIEQDTFLKIKEQYADAYKSMIDINKEIIEDNKGSEKARFIRTAKEAEQMNNELGKRLKRAESDITLQKNKRAIQKLSKGAKGSFFRNQLKKLRSDINSLQENIFKQNKLKDSLEVKTEKIGKEKLGKVQKLAEDFAKDKTEKTAENLAKESGESKESLKETVTDFGKKTEEAFKKSKEKGQKGEQDSKKAMKTEINKLFKKFKKSPKIVQALVMGTLLGITQDIGEELFGFKIPAQAIFLLSPSKFLVGKLGATFVANQYHKGIQAIMNRFQASEFKKALQTKNTVTINKARKKLQEKYPPKRIKKIEEIANAA